MILKWLFPGATEPGDRSELVEAPDREFVYSALDDGVETTADNPPKGLPILGFEVLTETATIIIYDLQALAHRRNDDVDWWADAAPELEELRNRNLLILGVQADGFYDLDITIGEPENHEKFSLQFPSGMVFIGPGEEITGGGGQPTGKNGGLFISLEPGDYAVSVQRVSDERISLQFCRGPEFENDAIEPVRI